MLAVRFACSRHISWELLYLQYHDVISKFPTSWEQHSAYKNIYCRQNSLHIFWKYCHCITWTFFISEYNITYIIIAELLHWTSYDLQWVHLGVEWVVGRCILSILINGEMLLFTICSSNDEGDRLTDRKLSDRFRQRVMYLNNERHFSFLVPRLIK